MRSRWNHIWHQTASQPQLNTINTHQQFLPGRRDECDSDSLEQGSFALPPIRDQSLAQRLVREKNRCVQRILVSIGIAQPSKNTYLTKKRHDYTQAVAKWLQIKTRIQQYTDSLVKLCESICIFAGSSSDVRNNFQDQPTFLLLTDNLKDKAHEYRDEVTEKVVYCINDHIIELKRVRLYLQELANLQLDVDYARRELSVAQQKGDMNRIAVRKRSVQTAEFHRKEAIKKVSNVLRSFDIKQRSTIENAMNQFATVTKSFFLSVEHKAQPFQIV